MTATIAVVHLLARVGDSEVLNEIATVDVTATVDPEGRTPSGEAGAVIRLKLDLAKALRDAADELDARAQGWTEAEREGFGEAWKRIADHQHRPVQHRDGKPPWCSTCGLTSAGQEP
jgi:hypothetical protein